MDPGAFAKLNSSEAGHFWFEPRNRLIVGLLNRYFQAATSFLEIGCGTGFVLSAVATSRPWRDLVGTELQPEGLAFARTRLPAAELVELDARAIPFHSRFDVIGAFDVIEHIEEDAEVLARCYDALKPGGGIIITVPQHQWLWSEVDALSGHVRRYSRAELVAKLQAAGFDPLFVGSYTFALLPLMLASRMRKRDNNNLADELALPPPINAVLRIILEAEVTATLRGIRWPAGGSLVAIARALR